MKTDTDRVRRGEGGPQRVYGPRRAACGRKLEPLDIPCCGWGKRSNPRRCPGDK